jgi:hypothetical protein
MHVCYFEGKHVTFSNSSSNPEWRSSIPMLSVRWILPIPCQGAFHSKRKGPKLVYFSFKQYCVNWKVPLLESVLLINLIAVPYQQPIVCVTIKFRVCKSVHIHTFKSYQPDASVSQIYCSSFRYSSPCFGHPHAHYQELINCSNRLRFTVGMWW